eukprot:Gb_14697 [translate_table: standard]
MFGCLLVVLKHLLARPLHIATDLSLILSRDVTSSWCPLSTSVLIDLPWTLPVVLDVTNSKKGATLFLENFPSTLEIKGKDRSPRKHAWRLPKRLTTQPLNNEVIIASASCGESVEGAMAGRSFWVIEVNEDHLGVYAQEWECFSAVNNEGQRNRLLMQGHEIDPKEESKWVERDIIIQRLYQSCEGTEVWNKSNGFIINRMTHEGAKWASRIIAKRLIDLEASTYLSHQWVAIALKIVAGITYAWAPWFAEKLKDHCRAFQMIGFRVKEEERDLEAFRHLGNFYFALRRLNDGPDRRNELLEYIKRQWSEVEWVEDDRNTYASLIVMPQTKKAIQAWAHIGVIESTIWKFKPKWWANRNPIRIRDLSIDYPFVSPNAQYQYWTSNATTFSQEPYGLPWSPSNLPVITFPEVCKRDESSKGKDKFNWKTSTKQPKSKSLAQVVTTLAMIQPLASLPPLHNQQVKTCYSPIGAKIFLGRRFKSLNRVDSLGRSILKGERTIAKQKVEVLKEIPLTSSTKEGEFSEFKSNYDALQLRCGILEGELQSKESPGEPSGRN